MKDKEYNDLMDAISVSEDLCLFTSQVVMLEDTMRWFKPSRHLDQGVKDSLQGAIHCLKRELEAAKRNAMEKRGVSRAVATALRERT